MRNIFNSKDSKMELEIVLEQEEDGTYSVHCPALKYIQEAIQLYLEVANEKARKKVEGQLKNMLRLGDIEDVYKRVKR